MSEVTNPFIGLAEQIACIKREIAQRDRVYPRLIGKGSMTPAKARREIAAMYAVLRTLEQLEAKERLL